MGETVSVKKFEQLNKKELVEKHKEVVKKYEELEKKNKEVVEKHNALVAELRANVECPVCLVVPTDGIMASCPKGHLVCSPCHQTMVAQGLMNCPNCREPMGNNLSLLAKTVIENIEHECTNEGCDKKLSSKEVVKHKEELCEYRKVLCPGCKATLSFCRTEAHFLSCPMIYGIGYIKGLVVTNVSNVKITDHRNTNIVVTSLGGGKFCLCFQKDLLDDVDKNNSTILIFNSNNEVFAVQMKMAHGNISFPVLMLANREKCERFQVTIEIQDCKSETAFRDQFNPVPLDMENSDEASLVVHKKRFARKVTDGDNIKFNLSLKVSEKREIYNL